MRGGQRNDNLMGYVFFYHFYLCYCSTGDGSDKDVGFGQAVYLFALLMSRSLRPDLLKPFGSTPRLIELNTNLRSTPLHCDLEKFPCIYIYCHSSVSSLKLQAI